MERIVQVARETGYFDGVQDFRSMDTYGYLPHDKVVALCTGSQGEPRAALARIAQADHPEVTLSKGDRVIFSSRAIPGNEKAVSNIINGLITQGVEVITDRTHLVHVSGHPRRDELEEMIGWVRPQMLMPVHGEPLHLQQHAEIARKCGIKTVLSVRDGDVMKLAPGAPGIVDEVPVGRLYRDGRLLVTGQSRTLVERRRLAFAGIVSVAIAMTDKGEIASDPQIEVAGVPERNAGGEDLSEVVYDAVVDVLDSLPRGRRRDPDAVAESVARTVRSLFGREWGKKPVCHVHVLTV
jgi:ribonuclease J